MMATEKKQNNKSAIPKGYNQTEVGLIPEDWRMVNLGENSVIKARIGWQGLTTAEYLKSGDYYLITGTDFLNGFIDWDNCVYVEKERYIQDKNIQIVSEDILVTKDGTIGKVAFIERVTLPTTLNSGVFVIRPKRGDYHPRYLYHILMSEYFKDFLGKLTAGSTISHLYQKDFVHYVFPSPPTLTEQHAIATALSDVDALIGSLEQLIAKKKAIKQGAMQALLTPPSKGGKRLEGFSGEWEEVTLGDIGQCIIGLTYSPTNVKDSGTLVLRSSNIQNSRFSSHDNGLRGFGYPRKNKSSGKRHTCLCKKW
ncbi:MAG: restriction endonuclease subunit S [Cryomorphaceae bacterium]|nr:restriction endonuclease subunit S [Cryomorphaceae bacterium]